MLWPRQVVTLVMKICKKCGESKPLASFYKGKCTDGHRSACKVCLNSISKARAKANPEKVRVAQRVWSKANPEKVLAAKRAWRKANKEKVLTAARKWRLANPEEAYAAAKRWRLAHPDEAHAAARKSYLANREEVLARASKRRLSHPDEKRAAVRKWQKTHPEESRAASRKWAKANPGKCSAQECRRKAAKLRAVPKWSETELIKIVYEKASDMGFEVDHVVPLQSKAVCGLHVWSNLQLLSQPENGKKGNRHWPDMWGSI